MVAASNKSGVIRSNRRRQRRRHGTASPGAGLCAYSRPWRARRVWGSGYGRVPATAASDDGEFARDEAWLIRSVMPRSVDFRLRGGKGFRRERSRAVGGTAPLTSARPGCAPTRRDCGGHGAVGVGSRRSTAGATRRHEVRGDPPLGGAAGEAASADAEGLRGIRPVSASSGVTRAGR
jgi:hypothetical protein